MNGSSDRARNCVNTTLNCDKTIIVIQNVSPYEPYKLHCAEGGSRHFQTWPTVASPLPYSCGSRMHFRIRVPFGRSLFAGLLEDCPHRHALFSRHRLYSFVSTWLYSSWPPKLPPPDPVLPTTTGEPSADVRPTGTEWRHRRNCENTHEVAIYELILRVDLFVEVDRSTNLHGSAAGVPRSPHDLTLCLQFLPCHPSHSLKWSGQDLVSGPVVTFAWAMVTTQVYGRSLSLFETS